LLVPIAVGYIIETTRASISDPVVSDLKSAVNAEYLFIGLAVVAIVVAYILGKLSDKNPHMELDVPNKRS
ncbi:MAG: hypothetical protein RR770_03560, partial [Bacteroidales bacterium]